jgi:hypothetical protein
MLEPRPTLGTLITQEIGSIALQIAVGGALASLDPSVAIITHFVTEFIPRQRQDRLQCDCRNYGYPALLIARSGRMKLPFTYF